MTAAPATRRICVMQGETRVSDDPGTVFTTVLGSCIAACLYDPEARVGGMNHFLLAEPGGGETDIRSLQRYGVYAMEVLINAMLALGAERANLRARLFGGGAFRDGFRDIGSTNALFARRFLRDEGITLVGEDTGGADARRVEFRPTEGLARCRIARERPAIRPIIALPPASTASAGEVELF